MQQESRRKKKIQTHTIHMTSNCKIHEAYSSPWSHYRQLETYSGLRQFAVAGGQYFAGELWKEDMGYNSC